MKYYFAEHLPEEKEHVDSSQGKPAEFDFETVTATMSPTLTYENDSIRIYTVSSQGKSYTLVVYTGSDFDLQCTEAFYAALVSSQNTNATCALKGLLRILNVSRVKLHQAKTILLRNELKTNPYEIELEKLPSSMKQSSSTHTNSFTTNAKHTNQNNSSNSNNNNTCSKPSQENSNKNSTELFVFFDAFEYSIEEDIIERSLNQNNVLCERQILDSFQDLIDCFVLLGDKLVSSLTISSDFIVVGKERIAKILAIYSKHASSQPTDFQTQASIDITPSNSNNTPDTTCTNNIIPNKAEPMNSDIENCTKIHKLVPSSVECDIEKEIPRKTRSQTLTSRLEATSSRLTTKPIPTPPSTTKMEIECSLLVSDSTKKPKNSSRQRNPFPSIEQSQSKKAIETEKPMTAAGEESSCSEGERSACYELSLIYLRVSAFLSYGKFNPQKKHLDIRLLQIISSLVEYKISGLFEEIFDEILFKDSFLSSRFHPIAPMSSSTFNENSMGQPPTIFTFTRLSGLILRFRSQRVLFEIDSTTDLSTFKKLIENKTEISIHLNDKTFNRLNELEAIFEQLSNSNPIAFSLIHSFEFKADLCHLCDEGAFVVARILSYLPANNLESFVLSLRRNSISAIGIDVICQIAAQFTHLRVFRVFFSYNRVRNAGLSSIIRTLGHLEKLEVVDLRFFENQITEQGCKAFEELTDLTFLNVKYLNISLGNNGISDEGCKTLAKFLSGMRNLKQLSIFLESNQITSEGLMHLRTAFLRKNQIRLLILHLLCNRIDDEGMLVVLKNISKLTTLNSFEIILNENNLTEKTGEALGQAIKSMVHLTSLILSIRANKISNKGAAALGESLRSLKNLESLVLSLTNNNIGDEGGVPIGQNLKYLTKLQKLHLVFYENSVSVKSGKAIGYGLKNLTELNYLILGIGDNKIADEGAIAIGTSLSYLKKVKIFEIYLQNNEVGSSGASAIASGLKNMTQLKCLVFQLQHSQFGDAPMIALGRVISNLTQLASLDIYVERCGIGSAGGSALFKGISHLSKLRVMVLDFDSNSVGVLGGQTLGKSFETMFSLVDLKVYFKKNSILQTGGTALLTGLAQLKKLRSLNVDLYKNQTGDASFVAFGQSLAQLKSLRNLELSITFNGLTVDGAREFSGYFAQCTSLQEVYLYMQKNHLREDSAAFIAKAISCFSELLSLKISFGNNQIEDRGIASVIEGIANCKKLRVLFLYAYNIGMTGAGCVSIADNIRKLPALERFDFFTNSNHLITLKDGLSQLASTVIQNHQTLQMINIDHSFWEANIKPFIIPRSLNCVLNMQIIVFNRMLSKILQFHPRAILWDLYFD